MLMSLRDQGVPWYDTRWTMTPSTSSWTEAGERFI